MKINVVGTWVWCLALLSLDAVSFAANSNAQRKPNDHHDRRAIEITNRVIFHLCCRWCRLLLLLLFPSLLPLSPPPPLLLLVWMQVPSFSSAHRLLSSFFFCSIFFFHAFLVIFYTQLFVLRWVQRLHRMNALCCICIWIKRWSFAISSVYVRACARARRAMIQAPICETDLSQSKWTFFYWYVEKFCYFQWNTQTCMGNGSICHTSMSIFI